MADQEAVERVRLALVELADEMHCDIGEGSAFAHAAIAALSAEDEAVARLVTEARREGWRDAMAVAREAGPLELIGRLQAMKPLIPSIYGPLVDQASATLSPPDAREAVLEEAAKVADAKAAQHRTLQAEATARRPGCTEKFPHGPGHMAMTHGGLSGIYSELAAAIRALKVSRVGEG